MNPKNQRLQKHIDAHLWREREPLIALSAREVYSPITQKTYLNFSSNDYLGLAHHPCVIQATRAALAQYGVGASSAPTLTGYHPLQQTLEEQLCQWLNIPYGFVMSNGYLANVGVIPALGMKSILLDKEAHASLIDGARLAEVPWARFHHNDIVHCEQKLKTLEAPTLLVVEGVYSMSGSRAPLPELLVLAEKYNALVYYDDAHGIGVMPPPAAHPRLIYMGTLSKALGSYGAFVGCYHETLYHTLLQFTRTHLFNTALPPMLMAAGLAALEVIQTEPVVERLWRNIELFHAQAGLVGARCVSPAGEARVIPTGKTAIQPIFLESTEQAIQMTKNLKEAGFWVSTIRPPTVPTSQLRVVLNAAHTEEDIEKLVLLSILDATTVVDFKRTLGENGVSFS
jgi:8-amino-7-oxononanoate synthase